MQQRRGNRVDLPQPLRPGEVGLASDSKEVFIGLDPAIGITKQNANAININNIVGGYSYANGYLNNNVIRIILPSKRLTPGTFDGTSNSSIYTPSSASNQTHGKTVFGTNVGSTSIVNVFDNAFFQSTDLTVTKNGTLLTTNATRTTANLLSSEYIISSDTNSKTADHTITFGTQPTGSDDFTVSYYDNVDIIAAIVDSSSDNTIGSTDVQGFYQQYFTGTNIPDTRKLSNAYILADHVTGTAFIGLEDKHLEVVAYSSTVTSPSSLTLTGNITATRSAGSDLDISLASYTTLTSVVNAINSNAASNTWLRAASESDTKWNLYSTDGSEFNITAVDSDLSIATGSRTKASDSIKGKLEAWVSNAISSTSFNMFTSAQIKGTKYNSSATNIENYANVSASSDALSVTFTGNKEAENFSYIANRLYFANADADVTGLTNVKSNQRLLTHDDYDLLLSGSADSGYTAQTVSLTAGETNKVVDTFESTVYDSAIIEYSVKSAGTTSTDAYSRTGTLQVTGDTALADAALVDSGVVIDNNFTGTVEFTASMNSGTIEVKATNTLNASSGGNRPATVKYLVRKWLG
ncbi:hypothetical protein N9H30_00485 [bacterium]|nr:hypothetical protein [bacterium]|tara:strand:+ start:1602 stop:3341 length:1740 start_codon:yes stop_codon:yes gene_type:complete